MLNQAWANSGPGTKCGPFLMLSIRPAELEAMILVVSHKIAFSVFKESFQ